MRTPVEIARELAPAEAWQLKRLNRRRQASAPQPDERSLNESLIAKGLAEASGDAVYVTWLGHEVLLALS